MNCSIHIVKMTSALYYTFQNMPAMGRLVAKNLG